MPLMPLSWMIVVIWLCVATVITARFVYLLARSQTNTLERIQEMTMRIQDLAQVNQRIDRRLDAFLDAAEASVAALERRLPLRDENALERLRDSQQPQDTEQPAAPRATSFARILKDDPDDPV